MYLDWEMMQKKSIFVLYCAHLFVPLYLDHRHLLQRSAGVTFVGKI